MMKGHMRKLGAVAVLIFFSMVAGCGGGGGGDTQAPPPPAPTLQVLPASFDFGTVTTGNTPAPLEVKINNNGAAALNVSAITSSAPFVLDFNGGSSPCGTSTPTVAANGGTCTFEVSFQPNVDGAYSSNVQINSNASGSPFNLALSGTAEPPSSLTVRINQVQATCPAVRAFVSVTDQGGFPLTNLGLGNFTVQEGNNPFLVSNVAFVSQVAAPISIAVVMDYSGSLQDTPDAINDMQNGLVNFVQNLQAGDRVEIIKFGTTFSVVQPFTSDTAALETAILSTPNVGPDTLLYDSVNQAVTNAGAEANPRKAVIVITDGNDEGGNPPTSPFSTATLQNVIDNANLQDVPIFTIGIGSNLNIINLTDMADDTGGQFFESQISDNLNTIYQQISSILFQNQYVIDYNGGLASPQSAFLTITATTTITGSDMKLVTCP